MVRLSPKCLPTSTLELANLAWKLFQLLHPFAQICHEVADQGFHYIEVGYNRVAAAYKSSQHSDRETLLSLGL
jgi:hypothetical protein